MGKVFCGMEDAELRQKLETLERKVDSAYAAAEKSRKYLLSIIVGSAVAFVLPLIGLLFAIPSFIAAYSSLGGL